MQVEAPGTCTDLGSNAEFQSKNSLRFESENENTKV